MYMKSSSTQKRPSYKKVDEADREAQLSSRTDILSKSFATDLWMRVISRSVDDAALYKFMRLTDKELKEEEEEFEASAWNFLFNDNHRIPMDDYLVDIRCSKCNRTWSEYMSKAAGSDSICPHCGHKVSWKYTTYTVTDNQVVRDISLEELIALWGVEDIKGFRAGCRRRINEIVQKKLQSEKKRTSSQRKVKKKQEPKQDGTGGDQLSQRIDKLERIVEGLVEIVKEKK